MNKTTDDKWLEKLMADEGFVGYDWDSKPYCAFNDSFDLTNHINNLQTKIIERCIPKSEVEKMIIEARLDELSLLKIRPTQDSFFDGFMNHVNDRINELNGGK